MVLWFGIINFGSKLAVDLALTKCVRRTFSSRMSSNHMPVSSWEFSRKFHSVAFHSARTRVRDSLQYICNWKRSIAFDYNSMPSTEWTQLKRCHTQFYIQYTHIHTQYMQETWMNFSKTQCKAMAAQRSNQRGKKYHGRNQINSNGIRWIVNHVSFSRDFRCSVNCACLLDI